MSNVTQALRRKIGSAAELQSVVRTMKALAAANIGQYENAVRALADYRRTVTLGLGACLRLGGDPAAPAPAAPAGQVGAIVFGSDQGLVGQFNELIARYAVAQLAALAPTPRVWVVGERLEAGMRAAGVALEGTFAVPNAVQGIAPLIVRLLEAIEADRGHGAVSELYLYFNRTTAGEGYSPSALRLLPLDQRWRRELLAQPWPTPLPPEVLCSDTITLRALIREYLFISLFQSCTESLASENASRLATMDRADRNIDQLLDNLTHDLHQLRQADIDEELFDLVAGVELLTGAVAR